MQDRIRVRENGTRNAGCDESSGWVWHAASVLETEILHRYNSQQQSDKPLAGLQILELGSGTGWLALRLASRGATVMATDRPGAVSLLIQNITRNQERCWEEYQMELNIEVCTLHWEEEICNALEEMAFDLIIGSDLMYLEEFYRPLLYTLARYSSLSANSIVLSWEQRIPDQELKFMQLAKAIFSLDGPRLAGTNPITQNPVYVVQMTKANPPVE